jgi:hypothetical protein
MTDDEEKPDKVRGRPFARGESGNPHGRPRGSRNRRTSLLGELTFGNAEEIFEKVIKQALSGDQFALRLYFNLLPKNVEPPIDFEIPQVKSAADVDNAMQAVIEAALRGDLTPGQAEKIKGLIEFRVKTLETKDFDRRIINIERWLQNEERGV